MEFRRGNAALSKRKVRKALAHFFHAEDAGHDPNACAAGRWYCWMLMCDFEQAWRESDLMAARGAPDPFHLWDGSSFRGKHIVIRCLHGFGDAIQFIRYVSLLRPLAASVAVETHPELVSLFSDVSCVDRVVTWADGSSKHLTDWNQQIEVMQLPWAFRTTVSTIPGNAPYLRVTPKAKQRMSRTLGLLPGGLNVGLVWRSSDWNPARSVPIAHLAKLMTAPAVTFFSFQHGPDRMELNRLRGYAHVHDASQHCPNISDTAAGLMNMDLVITVDTMSAHLAGALGREVWTMLPFAADWRWMLNTNKTPWYPTMTLFRQTKAGDWDGVLKHVESKLRLFSHGPHRDPQ